MTIIIELIKCLGNNWDHLFFNFPVNKNIQFDLCEIFPLLCTIILNYLHVIESLNKMSFRRGVRTESTSHILDNDSNNVTIRKQKLRKYLGVSLRINVCLVIPLLALVVIRSMLHEQDKQDAKERDVAYKAANSENGVCLPCDSLGPGIKAENTLFDSIQYTKNGGKICCYQEQPYLQIMISRVRISYCIIILYKM